MQRLWQIHFNLTIATIIMKYLHYIYVVTRSKDLTGCSGIGGIVVYGSWQMIWV